MFPYTSDRFENTYLKGGRIEKKKKKKRRSFLKKDKPLKTIKETKRKSSLSEKCV